MPALTTWPSLTFAWLNIHCQFIYSYPVCYHWSFICLNLRTEVPSTQVWPDWGSNSWPPDHDSTFHVTEMPALTTWPSLTFAWLNIHCQFIYSYPVCYHWSFICLNLRTEVPSTQVWPDWGSNSWLPYHDSTFHVTEMPALTTWPSLTFAWLNIHCQFIYSYPVCYHWSFICLNLRTEVPSTQVWPDWGSNSWPPYHDSTFHVTEMPALTTWQSLTFAWLNIHCQFIYSYPVCYHWSFICLNLRTEVPSTQVWPDWGSNSWPPDHDSTFHVTEMPALTTWPSLTFAWLNIHCQFIYSYPVCYHWSFICLNLPNYAH